MIKKQKRIVVSCLLVIIILASLIISLSYASAITAKIGNGRMIINSEVGQKIERTIRVINDNTEDINISLFAGGDLVNNTKILDNSFILKAGEEKNARFSIYSDNTGKYTTKINVQFSPNGENESGAGLSAEVILNVYPKGQVPAVNENVTKTDDGSNNWVYILVIVAAILIIIVLILLNASRKKRVKSGGELNKLKHNEREK